ncbi:MAG: hypothetical protein LBC43_04930 [Bifidobacteriaceae bacterium]|jgi:hypothetical protein|nr:hypothetical protein [Bifidobacteriaceae bacterium]
MRDKTKLIEDFNQAHKKLTKIVPMTHMKTNEKGLITKPTDWSDLKWEVFCTGYRYNT